MLNAHDVHTRLRAHLQAGLPCLYTSHALQRMRERGYTQAHVQDILRRGRCNERCTEQNAYGIASYRIETPDAYVVIRFLDPEGVLVITIV